MAREISDFDRGALAVPELKLGLRRQVADFCMELRGTWDYDAISSEVECWGQEIVIDLYVELVVDAGHYVLWSFEITYEDGSWQIERKVEFNETGESGNTIIGFDPATYESFEQLLPDAPDMLAALFATRAQVERLVTDQKG